MTSAATAGAGEFSRAAKALKARAAKLHGARRGTTGFACGHSAEQAFESGNPDRFRCRVGSLKRGCVESDRLRCGCSLGGINGRRLHRGLCRRPLHVEKGGLLDPVLAADVFAERQLVADAGDVRGAPASDGREVTNAYGIQCRGLRASDAADFREILGGSFKVGFRCGRGG